jgi:predicted amidohydrolase
MSFTVASAQYPIGSLASWEEYATKLERWLSEAADNGAKLAVFPEYASMELASLDPATMGDLNASLAFVGSLLPKIDQLHAALSARFGMHILAASAPFRRSDGTYLNRARLFAPCGKVGDQDKLIMTRFEREQWGISAGGSLRLFETELGNIGVLICYDSEFPLLARALVEAGAQVLLVPSCTDSLQGYWRVRIASQARALEGQCYVIQAPLVGEAPWSPAVDINRGAAGIFGPPDGDFPDDGIVEPGEIDAARWVFGEIDIDAIAALQTGGAVLNRRDWQEQPGAGQLPQVEQRVLT